jgi:hypothetical protein
MILFDFIAMDEMEEAKAIWDALYLLIEKMRYIEYYCIKLILFM